MTQSRATFAALVVAMALAPCAVSHAATETPAAPDSVLSLEWLERTVLERNATLAASRAALDEARARAGANGALGDPLLDVMSAPRSWSSDAVDPA